MQKKICEMIALNEGYRAKLYKCTKGKNTIGYGFNLDDTDMPVEVADFWLNLLLDRLEARLKKSIGFYGKLDDARKAILLDMSYNLGISGLMQFKNMLYAMNDKRYEKAAQEMLDSDWALEVKGRSARLATIMRTGVI